MQAMHTPAEHCFADTLDRPLVIFKMQDQIPDWELGVHHHLKNQFVVCLTGLVTLETAQGIWILPPNSALWIPAFTAHEVKSYGYSSGYVLFMDPRLDIEIPDDFQMYQTTAFLKAMLLRAEMIPHEYHLPQEQRLMRCLMDEILGAPKQSFYLPMPQDPRLKKITDAMLRHPEQNYALAEWAQLCCMSERSMTRAFHAATRLSINQWRKKLHVILALQWLSEGDTVQRIAHRLSYDSDTSFIMMFKKMMLMSPKRYMKFHQQHPDAKHEQQQGSSLSA
ncbi:AraC-like DNA-binding protein [Acinetobacter calcoaceticus]|uniref:AraC-like DNA-binding protein n=1 Tax=Acinetobacter calcoaceticus TaxID=471 RepID=A0A4R1XYS4_ACICA|nr:AraC-like DNA-binding protein [Acinetobacter calcoaceticus]